MDNFSNKLRKTTMQRKIGQSLRNADIHPINHGAVFCKHTHTNTHVCVRSVVTISSYFVVGFAVKKGGALRLNCIG